MLRFLDLMGPFVHDATLCLRKLFESLTYRAYPWYVNLKPGSVRDLSTSCPCSMLSSFMPKPSSLDDLGRIRQLPWEDMDTYLKRFHDRGLDYYDPVEERILFNVCLHGTYDARVSYFYRNLSFSSFSKLMETSPIKESVRPSSMSRSSSYSSSQKRAIIVTFEKG